MTASIFFTLLAVFLLFILVVHADPLSRKLEQLLADRRFRKAHNMTKAELQAYDRRNFPKYPQF